jgi:hypothetical protein
MVEILLIVLITPPIAASAFPPLFNHDYYSLFEIRST